MDGPEVKWTVNDLFSESSDETFMAYHVASAGWDFMAPAGCMLGGILYSAWRPLPFLQMIGTGGLIAGCAGMCFGTMGMAQAKSKGELAKPLPWNEDGVKMRVDGLKHNYTVRIFDKCAWIGIAAGGALVALSRGPTRLGLSRGLLGTAQALTLGSSLGSFAAAGLAFQSRSLPYDD